MNDLKAYGMHWPGLPMMRQILKAISELMLQITKQIKSRGWNLEGAAKHFNASQHEIQSLVDGEPRGIQFKRF